MFFNLTLTDRVVPKVAIDSIFSRKWGPVIGYQTWMGFTEAKIL